MTESQIIEMLSSPTQQCCVERGRIQVRRHRPTGTSEIEGERYWSERITVAVAPLAGRRGQTVKRGARCRNRWARRRSAPGSDCRKDRRRDRT
ncbi:MAG: hypothetical protein F4213_16045 [Boseongicola sp. SB0677_bin_26]|nr:hypothetical protein [Boseongicola sp. SB0677_bin_26]